MLGLLEFGYTTFVTVHQATDVVDGELEGSICFYLLFNIHAYCWNVGGMSPHVTDGIQYSLKLLTYVFEQ